MRTPILSLVPLFLLFSGCETDGKGGVVVGHVNLPVCAPCDCTASKANTAAKAATDTTSLTEAYAASRAVVEARLNEHAAEIEAAFATLDCGTIALKRKAVEDPASYEPELPKTLIGDKGVRHSKWEEYDSRYEALGCNLKCDPSATMLTIDNDKQIAVKGKTSSESGQVCYRLRNNIGNRLLSVRARVRLDVMMYKNTKGTLAMRIPATTGEGDGEDGSYASWATFALNSVTAVLVESEGDGVPLPEEVPFILEITPIMSTASTGRPTSFRDGPGIGMR